MLRLTDDVCTFGEWEDGEFWRVIAFDFNWAIALPG